MSIWTTWLVGLLGMAAGLTSCAALALVEWTAWVLVLPGRAPGSLGETKTTEEVGQPIEAIAADGVRLAGRWYANTPPSRDLVLLVHGFAENPAGLRERVAALRDRGWDVAALDTRAHGRSGGDRGSFGGREVADLAAWLDSLPVAGRPVVVWGRSMGAAITARAAAADHRLAAVVLEAPYVDLTKTLTSVLRRKRLPLPGLLARLALRRARSLAGVSLARPRPIDVVAQVACPALVVHGTADTLVPLADAQRLARSFTRPTTCIEVSGAGHANVVETGGPALLDRIVAFLEESTATAAQVS